MGARAAGLVVLLVLAAPFAASALPPAVVTDPAAEIVSRHALYLYSTQHVCSSSDPVVGIVSTDLTSRLASASEGGSTTFTLHLDAIPGDAECPALDFVFTAPLAYPSGQTVSYAPFSTTCGATGAVVIYEWPTGNNFQLYVNAPNGECGVPGGFMQGGFTTSPVVAGTALACGPLVVPACVGVYEHEPQHWNSCDGQPSSTNVVVVIDVVSARRQCQFWSDGREHVIIDTPLFPVFTIDATEDSCTMSFTSPIGVGDNEAACPEEVRAAVYGADWGHVLP